MIHNTTFEVNEQENYRILELHKNATKNHYILKEQNEVKPEQKTIPLNLNWGRGKWKITNQQINLLTNQLVDLVNFINKNKGGQVTIQIRSGESRVTNYDREASTETKLDPGILSERRGNSLVVFLKGYFENLVSQGKISEMPVIPKPITVIGDTEYTGIKDLKDPSKVKKYNSEQFVEAIISLKKEYECLVGLEVTIGYYRGKGKSGHKCDEAIFEIKMNGVPLGEVNLNNDRADMGWESDVRPIAKEYGQIWNHFKSLGRYTDNQNGGTRYQTFIIDDAKAKQIISQSKQDKITLSLVPLVGIDTKYRIFHKYGSHSETPWVTIKNKNGVLYDGEPNVDMKRGDLTEKVLLQTDLCGNIPKK